MYVSDSDCREEWMTGGKWSRRGLLAPRRRPLAPTKESETKPDASKMSSRVSLIRLGMGFLRIFGWLRQLKSLARTTLQASSVGQMQSLGFESCCHRPRDQAE